MRPGTLVCDTCGEAVYAEDGRSYAPPVPYPPEPEPSRFFTAKSKILAVLLDSRAFEKVEVCGSEFKVTFEGTVYTFTVREKVG